MSFVKRVYAQSPIYATISAGLLLTTILLLSNIHASPPPFSAPPLQLNHVQPQSLGPNLAERLQRSEILYQRSKARRRELTQKYPRVNVPYPQEQWDGSWPAFTFWDFYYPSFNCPHELERIGAVGDGGKWICGLSRLDRQRDCVIYSFGINYESSFEAELLERAPNCQVWGYDFSTKDFGPEISKKPELAQRGHFFPRGLAGTDNHNGDPPMYTLESLMRENKHDFIDILKIDIETYEFDTMRDILKAHAGKPLPFGQLQIEVHAWETHFKSMDTLKAWFDGLEEAGLRPFMNEPNLVYANVNRKGAPELMEYSFINVLGNHALVSDD